MKVKGCFVVAFLVLLTLPIMQVPEVFAANSPADTSQVLVFLRDVVGIDLDSYEIARNSYAVLNESKVSFIKEIINIETTGSYQFTNYDYVNFNNSLLHCGFKFINATLVSATLYVDSGKPIFSKPLPANLADASKIFLARYQNFTKDTQLTDLQSMLINVDSTKNSTVIVGNLKLEVLVTSYGTSFCWKPTFNSVDYPGMGITFCDGFFHSFGDDRSIYTIAKADVNISKEQAIKMALERAKAYSYTYNEKVISNFSIVEDQILTELRPRSRNHINELYPSWMVLLPLSDVYPGFVSVIRVEIWADTGEIIACQSLGYGGPIPSSKTDDSTSNNATPTLTSTPENTANPQIENNTQPHDEVIIILLAIAVLIPTLIAGAVMFRKRIST
jgi:hypothetical protein